jgi:hypothetical protein
VGPLPSYHTPHEKISSANCFSIGWNQRTVSEFLAVSEDYLAHPPDLLAIPGGIQNNCKFFSTNMTQAFILTFGRG